MDEGYMVTEAGTGPPVSLLPMAATAPPLSGYCDSGARDGDCDRKDLGKS